MPEKKAIRAAEKALRELVNRHTAVTKAGFSINIEAEEDRWHECLQSVGVRRSCELMAQQLSRKYEKLHGCEFLFSERCMAFELRYHIAAYMWARGRKGYARHLSTLLFSREALVRHCRTVEIDTGDVHDRRQLMMFGYYFGVRPCWRHTEKDPYRRLPLFWKQKE